MNNLIEAAKRIYDSGIVVLPALRKEKRPVGAWKRWTKERPDFDAVFYEGIEARADAICVVCGAVSGGLEIIDFDQKGKVFDRFNLGSLGKLTRGDFPVESTQSGGRHIAFRSSSCGKNQKLASDERGVLIETRGEGGICLIAPSDGYELISGDWANVPTVSDEFREKIFEVARHFDRTKKPIESPQTFRPSAPFFGESAADYLRRDLAPLRDSLRRAGWRYLRTEGDFEQWERPDQPVSGKPGGSVNVKERYFYCFTSNAPPFEPNRTYSPLSTVALLDFGGDESAASKTWTRSSRRRDAIIDMVDVGFDGPNQPDGVQNGDQREPGRGRNAAAGPPKFPEELFTCSGMLEEIQTVVNDLAIRPQPEGAFLGALCSLSYLTGRGLALNYAGNLVMPNLYGLFLAPSGMGKEAIRRVASEISRTYDPVNPSPESFASVQALQNMISRVRKILWLHDEFGRDLAVMSGEKSNSNVTSVITESLKLYTSSSSRRYLPKLIAQEAKAVKRPEPVDRPSLTIFATGNPREYFDAASDALLRNGYVARFTTVMGRTYSEKKKTSYEKAVGAEPFALSKDMIDRVQRWRSVEIQAEEKPFIVPFDRAAFDVVQAFDEKTEKEIRIEIFNGDGAAEMKARFSEKVWKYALLFAASRYGFSTSIKVDRRCAEQAVALVDYEARLFAANVDRFSQTKLSKFATDVLEWARAIGGFFRKTEFTRKFFRRGVKRERDEILDTLIDAGFVGVNETGDFFIKD